MSEAVVAVEEDETLASEAASTLADLGVDNAVTSQGALAAGDASHGPYDVIIVEGGVEELPTALTDQLKDGGRIVAIFLDGPNGQVRMGTRSGDRIDWRYVFDATAPLLPGFARESAFQF